jgi:putative endonuclease
MKQKPPARKSRQAAERRGRRSELLASLVLLAKGYRILGRRVRTRLGEIDLIARSPRGVICFIEVKARDAFSDAVEAVGPRQQARIARAARTFSCTKIGYSRERSALRYDYRDARPPAPTPAGRLATLNGHRLPVRCRSIAVDLAQ